MGRCGVPLNTLHWYRPTNEHNRATHTSSSAAILINCSKGKVDHGALAKDLYRSPYFSFMREYAERSEQPWFILSAKHGLVSPDTWLEPYDQYLPNSTREYRRLWGERVAQQLTDALGSLSSKVIEIHAAKAYVAALDVSLTARGAEIINPLEGLPIGSRMAWYRAHEGTISDLQNLITRLGDKSLRRSVDDFLSVKDESLNSPGIYGWWVDSTGAAELSLGLKEEVKAGLLYAGLAGATRAGGKRSNNTLHGRIAAMHLGKKHAFSTLRYSVGSILAAAHDASFIDEELVTEWMRSHLSIAAIPVADADSLGAIESEVLTTLDPPLNLAKVSGSTPGRTRLKALRKRYLATGQ